MKIYKYDTHVHTNEVSRCGQVPAKNVVKIYLEAGYHGIVITDHYYDDYFENLGNLSWDKKIDFYLEGFKLASAMGEQLGLQVILGMEIRFTENANDYLVYGIDETFLKENKELYKLNLKTFADLISGRDILIVQAHPFRQKMIPASPKFLDGVEVYNGNPRHDSKNDMAYEFALKNQLIMLSGSDFHRVDDLSAAGGIITSNRISTSHELVKVIKDLKVTDLLK